MTTRTEEENINQGDYERFENGWCAVTQTSTRRPRDPVFSRLVVGEHDRWAHASSDEIRNILIKYLYPSIKSDPTLN